MVESKQFGVKNWRQSIDSFTMGGFLKFTAVGSVLFLGVYVASRIGQHYLDRNYPEQSILQQKNVMGGPQPELYIEHDGVRYFSQVDGKDISELVK